MAVTSQVKVKALTIRTLMTIISQRAIITLVAVTNLVKIRIPVTEIS